MQIGVSTVANYYVAIQGQRKVVITGQAKLNPEDPKDHLIKYVCSR